jgi:hypothetical protein
MAAAAEETVAASRAGRREIQLLDPSRVAAPEFKRRGLRRGSEIPQSDRACFGHAGGQPRSRVVKAGRCAGDGAVQDVPQAGLARRKRPDAHLSRLVPGHHLAIRAERNRGHFVAVRSDEPLLDALERADGAQQDVAPSRQRQPLPLRIHGGVRHARHHEAPQILYAAFAKRP